MKLEEKLVQLRRDNGLSQTDVAERLDLSRQAISRWEVGASLPSTENLKALARLYGVSVDMLLDERRALGTEEEPQMPEEDTPTPVVETEVPQQPEKTEKKKSGRWQKLILAGALALGMFALGCFVGYRVRQTLVERANICVIFVSQDDMTTVHFTPEELAEVETATFRKGWPH